MSALIALVVLGGGAAAYWHYGRSAQGTPDGDIPTMTVSLERFGRRITAEGNLKAVQATTISPPMHGRRRRQPMKIEWMAPDGSQVDTGDVIIRFDPSDFERELQESQADLAIADTQIARERVQAQSAEKGRETARNLAQLELEKTRKLQRKDEEIYSRHQIVEAEIDENLSEARMDHATEVESIERRLTGSKLAVLSVGKRKASQSIEQAQGGLQSLEVKAPHAGILVFNRNWRGETLREGDQVWPGMELAEIPLLDEMEAQVFVLEVDAGGLEAGVPATLVVESHPEREYQAEVKQIDDLAKPRIRGLPVQYFGLTLSLERTDKDIMKPGQRVRATLILDKDEAMVVPRQAVIDLDGQNVVYRRSDAGFEPVAVEVGAGTPGRVVIESGLEPGDVIALRDPTRTATPAGDTEATSDQNGADH